MRKALIHAKHESHSLIESS